MFSCKLLYRLWNSLWINILMGSSSNVFIYKLPSVLPTPTQMLNREKENKNKIKQVPGDRKTTAPTKTWPAWLKGGLNTVIRTVATSRWEYNRAAETWHSGGIHIRYKQGLVLLGAPCPKMPFHDSASLEFFQSLASVPLLRRSYPLQNWKKPWANQKWHLCGHPRMFPPKLGPPDPALRKWRSPPRKRQSQAYNSDFKTAKRLTKAQSHP